MNNDFEKGLFDRLVATGTDLAALVSTKIYNQIAPPGATLPYVIFSHAGGGDRIIAAVTELFKIDSDSICLIAGHGPQRRELEACAICKLGRGDSGEYRKQTNIFATRISTTLRWWLY